MAEIIYRVLSCIISRVASFILSLFGMSHILRYSAIFNHHLAYFTAAFVVIYAKFNLMKYFEDDIIVADFVLLWAYLLVIYTLQQQIDFTWYYIISVVENVLEYGSTRVLVFVLAVSLCAYLLVVHVADTTTVYISGSLGDKLASKIEDNIISVDENRKVYDDVKIHPFAQNVKCKILFNTLYRYPMEDVTMKCTFVKRWFAGSESPKKHEVVWRRDGLQFLMTDRHRHNVTFREIPLDSIEIYKELGINFYEVTATLSISLLDESEFGSYTCHSAPGSELTYSALHSLLSTLLQKKFDEVLASVDASFGSESSRPNTKEKTTSDYRIENIRENFVKKNVNVYLSFFGFRRLNQTETSDTIPRNDDSSVEHKRLFQDLFLQKAEFRVINQLPRKSEVIRVPTSSMLHLTTSYYHLSAKDDVQVEYLVNGEPYTELCPEYFRGCSMILLLYWKFGSHSYGNSIHGIPPLNLHTDWEDPIERSIMVHCMCERAFGNHSIKYWRQYYNSTSNRSELVEVNYPVQFRLLPEKQNMLSMFASRVQWSLDFEEGIVRMMTSDFSSWDLTTIREVIGNVVTLLYWYEVAVLVLAGLLLILALKLLMAFLAFLGRQLRKLTLGGSMMFLSTARLEAARGAVENIQQQVHYDVFLSYSGQATDAALVHNCVAPALESKGVKVCVKDRDIAVNVTEVEGISQAVEASERFVIFLSQGYLDDRFCSDMEAPVLVEVACCRPAGADAVMCVRLDHCPRPAWLRTCFQTLDWTSSTLTNEDKLLQLLRWLEPAARKGTLRSWTDAVITLLPLLLLLLACFVLYIMTKA